MHGIATDALSRPGEQARTTRTQNLLREYFEGQRQLRKGLCLINAGLYDAAFDELRRAAEANPRNEDLPRYLIAALIGAERYAEAADAVAEDNWVKSKDVDGTIRLAMLQWKSGRADAALQTLREAVADNVDNAELHFQLGTLLAAMDEDEEAEMRFVQAIAIDKNHADALASLAMCRAMAGDVSEALRHLQRAQNIRPGDVRIARLLTQAARAAKDAGMTVGVRVEMPDATEAQDQDTAIERLSQLIEKEPEFAESFLSLEEAEVDATAFQLLAATLKRAIERNPHRAPLHYLRGKALERMGRAEEAIEAAEQAVNIDPKYVQALILLAELYRRTDRTADARARLEETVLLGAEYADTYYLLGNLYRDDGQLQRARWAYEKALAINERYEAARQALAALAA